MLKWWWLDVRWGSAPDSCRCFHHQEDVNSIEKSPPERSAEKQLDPHLQHIDWTQSLSYSILIKCTASRSWSVRWRWFYCTESATTSYLLNKVNPCQGTWLYILSCQHRRPLARAQCCSSLRCRQRCLEGPARQMTLGQYLKGDKKQQQIPLLEFLSKIPRFFFWQGKEGDKQMTANERGCELPSFLWFFFAGIVPSRPRRGSF